MVFLNRLKERLGSREIEDPYFGRLRFMRVPGSPDKSYWEGQWSFPPLGIVVDVALPGSDEGPFEASRAFYRRIVEDFDEIVNVVQPTLSSVLQQWLSAPMGVPIWDQLRLAGFDLRDPVASPCYWEISFETIGPRWLGITIPFFDRAPQEPLVDGC